MTSTSEESGPADQDMRRTLRDVRRVARLLLQGLEPDEDGGPSLLRVLEDHIGARPDTLPVTGEQIPLHRVVDADIALAEIAGRDPEARLLGLGGGEMRHHATLGDQLLYARMGGGGSLGQVEYVQVATGPGTDDHRNVVASGLWLFRYQGSPVAVRMQAPSPQMMGPSGALDVLAADQEVSRELVAEVRDLMQEHSILRGQVVTFAGDPYGQGLAGMTFFVRPTMTRDDVVLPDGLLERISEHVLGIAEHRTVLSAHGQHLKRGILLFGPPGTGKTHTMRYLLSRSPGTTVVLLSGGSLQFVHDAAKLARAHQPAIVVLEDCDLIAEDRSFGPMAKPLLFEVLDALDGIDADADVAFLLTTNRVEQLERALSQRPGRVDLAAEIPLPDEPGRRALIRLYAGRLFSDSAVDDAARGSEGTTASFAKELVRRAVLLAAAAGAEPGDEHLTAALDALQSDNETLTRRLLGVGPGSSLDPGPFPGLGPGGF